MAGLQGALETSAPVSRLHEQQSYNPADFPVPTGREEEWRFTPLRRLRGLHGADPLPEGHVTVDVEAGPEVKAEKAGRGDPRVGASYVPADRVSARAYASFTEATVISVPAEAVTSAPTIIRVRGHGTEGASFGHTVVDVGPMARATLVLDHQGSATYADNVELLVGDGASLDVISLQDWNDDAVHLSHHHARLGQDARISHTVVSFGGDVVRIVPSVSYAGRGGDAVTVGMGSPGWPRKPTVHCTGTLTRGGTTIFRSVPASKLCTSMTDLSVSTVNRISPLATGSPSFLSHSTMALSSVICPNLGMMMGVAMCASIRWSLPRRECRPRWAETRLPECAIAGRCRFSRQRA